MDYKIVQKGAFSVLERVSVHSTENNENKASVPAFWARCRADGTIETLLQKACDPSLLLGICYATKEGTKIFEYSVGAECDAETPVPEGFRKTMIPARNWAVIGCTGAMPNAIQELWSSIEREFFSLSGYRPTGEFDIEAYPDGDMDADDYYCEIRVPVEKG